MAGGEDKWEPVFPSRREPRLTVGAEGAMIKSRRQIAATELSVKMYPFVSSGFFIITTAGLSFQKVLSESSLPRAFAEAIGLPVLPSL